MNGHQTGTVLITGATSGLGRYLTTELYRRGWAVHAHGRSQVRLADLASELPGIRTWQADLAALADVRRLAREISGQVDQLNVLVNNAAIGFGLPGGARQASADGCELRMAVNYLAPVLLTRRLLPLLMRSAPAAIVQVGSIGQVDFAVDDIQFRSGYNGVQAYRRSKLALVTHTFDLARDLDGSGVVVNCVHPAGFMDTGMVRESGIRPLSTVAQGGHAVLMLITDPALAALNGQFFDGVDISAARPLAYDARFQRDLRVATDSLLGHGRTPA